MKEERKQEIIERIEEVEQDISKEIKAESLKWQELRELNTELEIYMKNKGFDNAQIGKYKAINTLVQLEAMQHQITDLIILQAMVTKATLMDTILSYHDLITIQKQHKRRSYEQLRELELYGRIYTP